jgi:GGDEF domain-containing protein
VIMPATDGAGAGTAAERLPADLCGSLITRTAEQFNISICIGVTSHPGGEGISASRLLAEASTALWEAQRRGPKSLVVSADMRGKTD